MSGTIKTAYEIYDDEETGERVIRAQAPCRGIAIPVWEYSTTRKLAPGWYVATMRSPYMVEQATFSTKVTREYALKQVGGDIDE